jgi:hypothetical protein
MGSSGPDEATSGLPGREPATAPPVQPGYQPTYVPTRRLEAETVRPAPGADVASPPPVTDAVHQSPTTVVRRRPGEAVTPGEPVTYRPTPENAPPSAGPPPQFVPGGPPPGGPPPGGPPRGGALPAGVPPRSASDVLRYGPGVPASQAGVAAESVWRTGHRPGPPSRQGRLRRVRRVLGSALTVILLVVAGIVVWLRFFDHPAFHVTEVRITQQTKTGCGVNVTGKIVTNGSAGTVSYQWVFQPQTQAPQPLSQSVTAGQHDVFVTVAVQGQGHGTATQKVTLDVLGPDTGTDSADVTISC